jgi:hypothetical protein
MEIGIYGLKTPISGRIFRKYQQDGLVRPRRLRLEGDRSSLLKQKKSDHISPPFPSHRGPVSILLSAGLGPFRRAMSLCAGKKLCGSSSKTI